MPWLAEYKSFLAGFLNLNYLETMGVSKNNHLVKSLKMREWNFYLVTLLIPSCVSLIFINKDDGRKTGLDAKCLK